MTESLKGRLINQTFFERLRLLNSLGLVEGDTASCRDRVDDKLLAEGAVVVQTNTRRRLKVCGMEAAYYEFVDHYYKNSKKFPNHSVLALSVWQTLNELLGLSVGEAAPSARDRRLFYTNRPEVPLEGFFRGRNLYGKAGGSEWAVLAHQLLMLSGAEGMKFALVPSTNSYVSARKRDISERDLRAEREKQLKSSQDRGDDNDIFPPGFLASTLLPKEPLYYHIVHVKNGKVFLVCFDPRLSTTYTVDKGGKESWPLLVQLKPDFNAQLKHGLFVQAHDIRVPSGATRSPSPHPDYDRCSTVAVRRAALIFRE